MGRWIDDLAVEQVDTSGDGNPDNNFYPITDLLGSVQLLTDENGAVVQRITYDPDGAPRFWSKDGTQPSVTRLAWTGDGTLPTGDTVTPQAFEIGLSEPIDPASAANATATLTPDGGTSQTLTLILAADGRAAYLTGATVAAGTQYTLHLDGLTDTTHNLLWPEDAAITVADANAYEVLNDTTAPTLLAVLDGADALYLLFDEPVEPAAGYDMTSALSIVRSGQPVDGAATRLTPNLLEWQPAGGVGGLVPGGTYTLSAVHLTDLASNAATASATFTHLNTTDQMLLLAYQAPTDTQPQAQAAYGLTTLFQGRTWHGDLGGYYYRARWYLPEAGVFAERDPIGPVDSVNLHQALGWDPQNVLDPTGRRIKITDRVRVNRRLSKAIQRFRSESLTGERIWQYFENQFQHFEPIQGTVVAPERSHPATAPPGSNHRASSMSQFKLEDSILTVDYDSSRLGHFTGNTTYGPLGLVASMDIIFGSRLGAVGSQINSTETKYWFGKRLTRDQRERGRILVSQPTADLYNVAHEFGHALGRASHPVYREVAAAGDALNLLQRIMREAGYETIARSIGSDIEPDDTYVENFADAFACTVVAETTQDSEISAFCAGSDFMFQH